MLTDPLAVTYDSQAKSLPRSSRRSLSGPVKLLGSASYGTADGTFSIDTRQSLCGNGDRFAEVILNKVAVDTDPNTIFTGHFNNAVGLVFRTNPYGVGTSVDIPLIRAALLSFVDSTLQGRIISGEH